MNTGMPRSNEYIHAPQILGCAQLALAILKLQRRKTVNAIARKNNSDARQIHEKTIQRLTTRVR